MSKLEIRTLCGRCASDYVSAGYRLERITYIRHEYCEFCSSRAGTDYVLVDKKGKDKYAKKT